MKINKPMEQCPVCYSELEVRDCTPCDDCGGLLPGHPGYLTPAEPYKVFEVYRGIRLTLCHLCAIDFGSYQSAYFGFPNGQRIGYGHFNFVKEINHPQIVKDKYCPECDKRLNFLNFLIEIRQMNGIH